MPSFHKHTKTALPHSKAVIFNLRFWKRLLKVFAIVYAIMVVYKPRVGPNFSERQKNMKMTKKVSEYMIALALLLFSFTGTVSMLPETVITASAAMTAEQFISSGYDADGVELVTQNADVHVEGRVYPYAIIMGSKDSSYNEHSEVSFDVSGISKISFATIIIDDADPNWENGLLSVYADGTLVKEVNIGNHRGYLLSEIELNGAKKLTFSLEKTAIAIVDIGLDLPAGEYAYDGVAPKAATSTELLENAFNAYCVDVITNAQDEDSMINIMNTLYSEGLLFGDSTDVQISFNVENYKTFSFYVSSVYA